VSNVARGGVGTEMYDTIMGVIDSKLLAWCCLPHKISELVPASESKEEKNQLELEQKVF
jgi:hypothetical protein